MNLTHNHIDLPNFVYDDFQKLYDLYDEEEKQNITPLAQYTWGQAKLIYDHTNETKPFYIIFMVLPVHERSQQHLCKFAVVKNAKNSGHIIKNSLVWFCHKPKGIFKLATDLCDVTPLKHWNDKILPSASTKTLELTL